MFAERVSLAVAGGPLRPGGKKPPLPEGVKAAAAAPTKDDESDEDDSE